MKVNKENGPVSVSTYCEPVLKLAATWLSKCVESHAECSRQLDPTFRPTRLLRIEGQHGARIAKLEEASQTDEPKPYVALSYCWGDNRPVELLQSNYQQFMNAGFAVDKLPRTIKQAIDLAVILGIPRIWIDALCIFQDLEDDWKQESSRMGDIYGNCVVTIAAWGASSSEQGLFAVRDPLSVLGCKLFDITSRSSSRDCCVVARQQENLGITCHPSRLQNGPLYNRGWVMQERLFAPRTLNFGSFVSWECKRGACSEAAPDLAKVQHSVKTLFDDFTNSKSEIQTKHILHCWNHEIIPPYTSSQLTRKSDRLMAISGAIQKLSERTGWRNIHGLWEPYLVQQLQWTGSGSERTGAGPTWSWTSVDGPVSYFRGDWEVEWEGKTESEIRWRKLDTRKYMTRLCTVLSSTEDKSSGLYDLVLQGGLFELRLGEACSADEMSPYLFCAGVGEMMSKKWLFRADVSDFDAKTTCWFLPLVFLNPKWSAEIHLSGLGLVEVAGRPGTYERIGHVYGDFSAVPWQYQGKLRKPHLRIITLI
jgi:Heterokaryon incompatibility protein (HET)